MTDQAETKEQWLKVNGNEVRVIRKGEGPPLLWLHGANGGGWNDFLEALTSHFDVIAPDHPGFNQSSADKSMDTIEDMAFHYRDLLDKLDLSRVHIAASSLGAWIGLQFALTHEHRVLSMVLCNAAGINIPGVRSIDPFSMTMHELAGQLFYDTAKAPQLPPLDSMPIEMLRNRSMHARLMWEKGYDPKLLPRLNGVHTPALIVWGEADRLIPPEFGEKLADAMPNAEFMLMEKTGHLPYVEAPEALLEAVIAFIQQYEKQEV
ncbi:alpha/beta fold hydrolase [Alkalicoccus chagannorensis]|uniref:alpha/beta fold hydrolase n=1 Tax=Alkalicoccus chagannorensis TaxID=427072 RepID=UPI0003FFAAC9|nr:alpha/beta hydrolase [Alkalicoccus chagannorensis]